MSTTVVSGMCPGVINNIIYYCSVLSAHSVETDMFKHVHIRAVSMDYVARPHWSAYQINVENSGVVISVSNNIRTRRIRSETYWKHDDQASKFYQGGESTKENEGIYIIYLHYSLIGVVPFQY